MIIFNVLDSYRLLADAVTSLLRHMVDKMEPDPHPIADRLARSLMPVTALKPLIGHVNPVHMGTLALADDVTLRAVGHRLPCVRDVVFVRWVDPVAMTQPGPMLAGGGA